VSVVYGRLKNDKNLEQRINIKFCVKVGKSVSEMLAILTVACGEYVMEKWSVIVCLFFIVSDNILIIYYDE
jgi:hypothetical protein